MRSVEMAWRGRPFIITPDQAFRIGEEVEDIATLAEIGAWGENPRLFKLARAYATMLRFAGAQVSDAMVLESISPIAGESSAVATGAVRALVDLLMSGAKSGTSGDAPEKTSAS